MVRVCIVKATGKFTNTQINGLAGALLQSAINYGFSPEEVEEKLLTEEEYNAILDAQPKPLQSPTTEERLIAMEDMAMALLEMLA